MQFPDPKLIPLRSSAIVVFFPAGNSSWNETSVAKVWCCEFLKTAVLKTIVLLYIDCTSSKRVLLLVLSNETFRITASSGIMPKLIGFPSKLNALVLMITNPTATMTKDTKNIFLYSPNSKHPKKNSLPQAILNVTI